MDRTSSGRGVRQFKTALGHWLVRENEAKLGPRNNYHLEMSSFYQNYIRGLQNADSTDLTKSLQTAAVLFEVVKCVYDNLPDELLQVHAQVAEKIEMFITHDIYPVEPECSDQSLPRHQKMKRTNGLMIPLQAIKDCTQDFDKTNVIGKGGFGKI
ncbi:hypothetical protein L2E82_30713 [Cichorium intybus]|uniref:Uncharacterized protein n=1 Tax=Cichorium intybus TaxID=13427 RepID=A0ACB9D119_CICIN|nr:hypothetical protein L2E82_30713 [Cichorium intybus]